jgi:hypothetical protein
VSDNGEAVIEGINVANVAMPLKVGGTARSSAAGILAFEVTFDRTARQAQR